MVKSDIFVSRLLSQLKTELKIKHLRHNDTLVIDSQRQHVSYDNSSGSSIFNILTLNSAASTGLIICGVLPITNNVTIHCDIPIYYNHVPSYDKTYTLNGTATKFEYDVSLDRNRNKAFSLSALY